MYRNFFYLCRCAGELNSLLTGSKVFEAFTQEKDKLFLRIPLNGKEDHHIIFDCSPLANYVLSRDKHFKAKKNTISFFQEALPDRIKSVEIAGRDRVLLFRLEESELYFVIKGGNTNVILKKDDSIFSFKKRDSEDGTLPDKFIKDNTDLYIFLDGLIPEDLDWKTFSKKYPFAGKELFLYAKGGTTDESIPLFRNYLKRIIDGIMEGEIAVLYEDNEGKAKMLPRILAPESESVRYFDSYLEALNYYLVLKHKTAGSVSVRHTIEKYLDSEMEKLASKLNNLKFRIDTGTKEIEYRRLGTILLSNIHLVKKGMKDVELTDPENGETVRISLDEKLSPQKNIDRYFEKSKDEKINYEQSVQLYSASHERMEKLTNIRKQLEEELSNDELKALQGKLKISQQSGNRKMEEKVNYKHYILQGKYHVYVGKDSKNNDELTTQFAKQNDLWFHARGVPGSHVVLRVENSKEPVPKNIIKEAASLAAYYSKSKTSGVAPVSYTFKKYVHKKKGLEPGQVILSKESVILVKPEIPKGCEPVLTDLI